jgi:hypothetical protein
MGHETLAALQQHAIIWHQHTHTAIIVRGSLHSVEGFTMTVPAAATALLATK